MDKPKTIRLDHWLNMVEHTRDPQKIEYANVMRETIKYVKNVYTFRRSEGEVRTRLVRCHVFLVSFNHNILLCMFVRDFLLTSYMHASLKIEQRPYQDEIEVEFVRDKNTSRSKSGRLMSTTMSRGLAMLSINENLENLRM